MQGFNMGRYIPPDALDAGLTSANAAAGKSHALGHRARKINQGILTVRFEMPFAIWCTSCPKPTIIGQGVRFNAEKKKVGNYHSTPIWSFRIKHGACGGWIEIRTDPKNAEYVVHEGAKRRDYGEDKAEDRTGPLGEILTEEERERRRNDAFAAFEGKVVEKEKGKIEGQRTEELMLDRERDWKDPYAANQRLRKTFRAERKVRHRKEAERELLQERLGLGIELLDENEADRHAASLIEFGELGGPVDEVEIARRVGSRALFDDIAGTRTQHPGTQHRSGTSKTTSVKSGEQKKLLLQQELKGNTRMATDPFGVDHAAGTTRDYAITRLRRKADVGDHTAPLVDSHSGEADASAHSVKTPVLVDYDSD